MKNKYVDLQMHSLYSDGKCSPKELVEHLKKYNIKAASLTDHNTTKGIPEFIKECKKYNIKAIPGIELYVAYKRKKLHLLGYNLRKCVNKSLPLPFFIVGASLFFITPHSVDH